MMMMMMIIVMKFVCRQTGISCVYIMYSAEDV